MKAALLFNHRHFAAPTNHSILDSGNTAFTQSRPILPIQNIKSSDGIRFEDGSHLGGARPVFVKDALDAPRHGRVFDDDADLAAAVHADLAQVLAADEEVGPVDDNALGMELEARQLLDVEILHDLVVKRVAADHP